MRGEGRKELGGFWLEQLWIIVLFTRNERTKRGFADNNKTQKTERQQINLKFWYVGFKGICETSRMTSEVEEHHRSQMGDSRACSGVREWSSRKRVECGREGKYKCEVWGGERTLPKGLGHFFILRWKEVAGQHSMASVVFSKGGMNEAISWGFNWLVITVLQLVEGRAESEKLSGGRERRFCNMSPAVTPDAYCWDNLINYLSYPHDTEEIKGIL